MLRQLVREAREANTAMGSPEKLVSSLQAAGPPRLPSRQEAALSARFLSRTTPGCVELLFVCPGDKNGVTYWLATQGGQQQWVNPMLSGRVKVRIPLKQSDWLAESLDEGICTWSQTLSSAPMGLWRPQCHDFMVAAAPLLPLACVARLFKTLPNVFSPLPPLQVQASSPACRSTNPASCVALGPPRLNFAAPRSEAGRLVSWWSLDLGPRHQLACSAYTLRHDKSHDPLRSWTLQVKTLRGTLRLKVSGNQRTTVPRLWNILGANFLGRQGLVLCSTELSRGCHTLRHFPDPLDALHAGLP